jgi:hypothetical protein
LYEDRGFVESGLRGLLADDFVREDRRRLIALPTVDQDGWIEQLLSLFELGTGRLSMSLDEVVAVRGDRLALYWIALMRDGGEAHRILGIAQYDHDVQLVERFVSFDDLDLALVVLDEMARDLERHGGLRSPGPL